MRRYGFTTAEMLIVLGILAIVAGVFFPVVSNFFPNQDEKMHQKATYQLEQTVNQMYNDDNMYPKNSTYTKQGFKNTDEVVINGRLYGGNNKFCELFASQFKKKSDFVTCITDGEHLSASFSTMDNMTWYVPSSNFTKGYATVFVDINGDNLGFGNKTNGCTYHSSNCPNPDLYKYYVRANGTIVASSDNKTNPAEPAVDTNKPYSITVELSCSDNSNNCGSVTLAKAGGDVEITKPGAKVSGLAAGTYTLTAEAESSYYPNWTTRSVVVDGHKLNYDIKIIFSPIATHCVYVNVNDCDKASPSGCATFTLGGQSMSQKTDSSGNTYSTMKSCGLTSGNYTLSVTPQSGYKLDPVPKDGSGNPLASYTQNIKVGTEDVTITVGVAK